MKGPYPAGLLTSRRLPVFCQLILKIGNFLNYVSGQQPARHCSQTPDPPPPPGQGTPSPPPPFPFEVFYLHVLNSFRKEIPGFLSCVFLSCFFMVLMLPEVVRTVKPS